MSAAARATGDGVPAGAPRPSIEITRDAAGAGAAVTLRLPDARQLDRLLQSASELLEGLEA